MTYGLLDIAPVAAAAYDFLEDAMSDHAVLAIITIAGILVGIIGNVILGLQLREARRMTRAVGALVVQESDRIRAILGR